MNIFVAFTIRNFEKLKIFNFLVERRAYTSLRKLGLHFSDDTKRALTVAHKPIRRKDEYIFTGLTS